jgi:RNA polymerase sigma factor (sigma-70 family)
LLHNFLRFSDLRLICELFGRAGNFSRKTRHPGGNYLSAMAFDDSTPRPTPRPMMPEANRVDWTAALAEHGRWLRTVLLARVGNPLAVDDVMQDVAATALRQGDQLRDSVKVGPWLYRVALVAALQYRRRQGRQGKLVERYGERCRPSEADSRELDPLGWLLTKERATLVRQALEHLSRRDAEILLLKYTENWTYRQLAEHLGLSTSAVEARLHRARAKMRRALAVLDPSLSVGIE